MNQKIPSLYISKEDCCGCSACKAICPVDAISMLPDEEGFFYPVITDKQCIRCHQCLLACPIRK